MTDVRMTLDEAFTIPRIVSANDFVLVLNDGVAKSAETIAEYHVTPALSRSYAAALDYLQAAVEKKAWKAVILQGSFGSGKSHFMAILDLILRGDTAARGLPGLQSAISRHEHLLRLNFLTLEYHLIGAKSLEQALFSGYLSMVGTRHPGARPPMLHRSEALFEDAAAAMKRDPEGFFKALNAGPQGAHTGAAPNKPWGTFAGHWNAESFQVAAHAPVGDPEREKLAVELVATIFKGYAKAGTWVDISEGIATMNRHAKGLGYDAMVLFLDELVLWLAMHLGDAKFVSVESSKIAKLVEMGDQQPEIPMMSFVARQREMQDFLSSQSGMKGAERMSVGDAFAWWEDRFDKITLQAADLPKIAHQRLLLPKSPEAEAAIRRALDSVKANKEVWDALLMGDEAAGEAEFADVYPFSPALVDTLVVLSPMMQRERTALKVMAHLLVEGRDTMVIDDIIPAGDLYSVVVESGGQPLSDDVERAFDNAKRLYADKLRPKLLEDHKLTEEGTESLGRDHAFVRDDRLVKTLLIAALAPGVKSLAGLTPSRLAALNHGSVKTRIPSGVGPAVLQKVQRWAEKVGEIKIGEGVNPVIILELSGVDYDSILERVANEDNDGARRAYIRRTLFDQLGVSGAERLGSTWSKSLVWRGSKRELELVFGNIRDSEDVADGLFVAQDDQWRVVLDFPFDPDPARSPQDDVARVDKLRADIQSRTVAWVPSFFTADRMKDLGLLVQLDYLMGGTGSHFDEHAQFLPAEHRAIAKRHLQNRYKALQAKMVDVLKQAYGVAERKPGDIDSSYGDIEPFATLDPEFIPQRPIGADMGQALHNLADQMLSQQFPDHPRFEPDDQEVSSAVLGTVLDFVKRANADGGRVRGVENAKRSPLRRVANPLRCGQMHDNHFAFDAASFPWQNEFVKAAARDGLVDEVPVRSIRAWLQPYGLSIPVQNLLILAWSVLGDKEFTLHGTQVDVTGISQVREEHVLRNPKLPDSSVWDIAVERAEVLFGLPKQPNSAAGVRTWSDALRTRARTERNSAAELTRVLREHRATLGLDGAGRSARLADALEGQALVERITDESDDLVLVNLLANYPLPEEPHSIGTSLSSAQAVAAAIKGVQWDIIETVASRRAQDEEAARIIDALHLAARASELHAALEPALQKASNACNAWVREQLAGKTDPTGTESTGTEPTGTEATRRDPTKPDATSTSSAEQESGSESEPPTSTGSDPSHEGTDTKRRLDSITLHDVKGKLTALEAEITEVLRGAKGSTVHIQWWLE